jgi:DNA-binding transcriptional LysR family regulator
MLRSAVSEVQFRLLDLNLLRVFDALIEERSVTRAAARLNITPSAVSHALARLRDLFEDQLFVRGPQGMQATPRAAEIGPRLRDGLHQLEMALTPLAFDPQASTRAFTIAGTDAAHAHAGTEREAGGAIAGERHRGGAGSRAG